MARLLIAFILVIGFSFAGPANAQTEIWLGKAPFCKATPADCQAKGMTFIRTHASGDGDTCLTGEKVLCRGEAIDTATLKACPANAKGVKDSLSCSCADAQTKTGIVWGDTTYTDDSSICRAALHAGAIPAAGGDVRIEIRPGLSSYAASTANGVATKSYGKWGRSFVFVR